MVCNWNREAEEMTLGRAHELSQARIAAGADKGPDEGEGKMEAEAWAFEEDHAGVEKKRQEAGGRRQEAGGGRRERDGSGRRYVHWHWRIDLHLQREVAQTEAARALELLLLLVQQSLQPCLHITEKTTRVRRPICSI